MAFYSNKKHLEAKTFWKSTQKFQVGDLPDIEPLGFVIMTCQLFGNLGLISRYRLLSFYFWGSLDSF